MMRKNIFICILLLLFSISAWTQESVTVTGIVTDQNKEPLIGVNIAIETVSYTHLTLPTIRLV